MLVEFCSPTYEKKVLHCGPNSVKTSESLCETLYRSTSKWNRQEKVRDSRIVQNEVTLYGQELRLINVNICNAPQEIRLDIALRPSVIAKYSFDFA